MSDYDLYRAAAEDPAARPLLDAMKRVEDRIAAIEADAVDDDDPSPQLRTILEGLCRPDDAPLEWRSIGGRVERGTLTWQHFWAHPREEGPAGTALVAAALNASTTSIMDQLQGMETQLGEAVDESVERRRDGGAGGRDPGGPAHR